MKPINKIAIACFKKDMPLLRACVASIRYWYPEVEIYLIKDSIQGAFSTKEIEKYFQAKELNTNYKRFGWPWSKLSVLFQKDRNRWLFLDSDIVLLGPILEKLESFEEDFVVTGAVIQDSANSLMARDYIDLNELKNIDNDFRHPGYGFNGGQIVMTSGIFSERDFSPFVDFQPPMKNKYPKIFKHGDQGIMNYVFAKANQTGRASVRYEDFWIWPGLEKANDISLSDIKSQKGVPYVLHWAGIKPVDFRRFKRYDIFNFFEGEYYKKIPFGKIIYRIRNTTRLFLALFKILVYKILKRKYEK